MKLFHIAGLPTVVFLLFALGACQHSPREFNSSEETQEAFDQEEVVEAAENDPFVTEYLLPRVQQSPLQLDNNLWDRVRNGFQLDLDIDNPRIQRELNWYVKNPAYIDRVNTRATRYLWHIVEEIQRRDMPMEIALLPIVESAFDPFAYSHARASGMWQFIPSTAQFMQLERDWWRDERRGVMQSTEAALELLQRLYNNLGNDWLLALAAYNSGEGNVRKAIAYNKRKNKPTDFWNLRLPKETKAYVPKLLALAKLYKDPKQYNTYILPIANAPYFDGAETHSQIDLAQAARLARVELDEIYLLNPDLNRWATPPDQNYLLLLPRENIPFFQRAIKELPVEERVHWKRYTVEAGDTLSTIAQAHQLSAHTLASVNRLKSSQISQGASLMIPVASGEHYGLSQDQRSEKVRNMLADLDSPKIIHKVKSGESLWSISKKYRTTPKQIAKWNGMAVKDPLRIGRKLLIWKKGEAQTSRPAVLEKTGSAHSPQTAVNPIVLEQLSLAAPTPLPPASQDRKIRYRVRAGDSLGKIANRFGTSIRQITEWNHMDVKEIIRPGQFLVIHTDIADAH